MYPAFAAGVSSRMIDLASGVRVRVAEAGPASGAPVIMLHGWAASVYTFRHALELLPARGFRVIAVDMRGFGLSDKPTQPGAYAVGAYMADLDALFDALSIGRASMAGHSMGGGLALRYALARPHRLNALALINPTELVPISALVAVRAMPRWLVEAIGERMVTRRLVKLVLEHIAFGDTSILSSEIVDEYWAPTQIPGYMRALRRTAAEFDWTPISDEAARSLTLPTAVVLGTKDRLVRNAGSAARRLNCAAVHELEAGHCVHEERPREVYDIVAELVESVTG